MVAASGYCCDLSRHRPNGPHTVSLAAVRWDFALVGRTRMLTEAWRRLGVATTFVQVPSLRTGLQRVMAAGRGRQTEGVIRPWPVCPARWWPYLGERRLRAMMRARAVGLRRQLDRVLDWDRAIGVVISPVWVPWLEELPFGKVIYDCIDDVSVHAPLPVLRELYAAWEQEMICRADGVVVTADVLARTVREVRPDVPIAVIRNGVNDAWFRSRAAALPRPADVPGGKPIVGFVGALYGWIDWALVQRVVRMLEDVRFVFVGPDDGREEIGRLATLPHVHFLGRRPYEQVPAYMRAFDVCWVPFCQDRVGLAANPVKVYEYLALGKPVVSTPVADVEAFEGLVEVGRTPDEVAECLRRALRHPPTDAEARSAFAARNSWATRAAAYAAFAADLLSTAQQASTLGDSV